ncbi:MAG: hypothetical protein QW486_05815 [Candidatus Bathyarchaeia archaeon]
MERVVNGPRWLHWEKILRLVTILGSFFYCLDGIKTLLRQLQKINIIYINSMENEH